MTKGERLNELFRLLDGTESPDECYKILETAWNEGAQSPVAFTPTEPTVPGWYWYQHKLDTHSYVAIVEVRDRGYLYAKEHGPVTQMLGNWAGPLQPPKEE